jgi:hypothetical protein
MLFRHHGLIIQDVERLDIHGGSLLVTVCKKGVAEKAGQSTSVCELLQEEAAFDRAKERYGGCACRMTGTRRRHR